MISKTKARFIKSLQVRKYRLAEQCFIVQGAKAVKETLDSAYEVMMVAGTDAFLGPLGEILSDKVSEILNASEEELSAIGSLESNHTVLAVVRMKPNPQPVLPVKDYHLVLDDIRDPGNLGTIIRTADWYGIKHIVASEETTDFYSPKVINATMGSFLRVHFSYTSLESFLSKSSTPVYGTFLKGENVHRVNFSENGLIVIGNESKGISPAVEKWVTKPITIPRFGKAESLNASTATAIVLDNLRRRL